MATEPGAAPAADAPAEPPREAVDWDLASRRAHQLTRPGPAVSPAQARDFVAELRESALAAPAHVGAVTGLLEPAARAGAVDMVSVPAPLADAVPEGFRAMPVKTVDNRGLSLPFPPDEGRVAPDGGRIGSAVTVPSP